MVEYENISIDDCHTYVIPMKDSSSVVMSYSGLWSTVPGTCTPSMIYAYLPLPYSCIRGTQYLHLVQVQYLRAYELTEQDIAAFRWIL